MKKTERNMFRRTSSIITNLQSSSIYSLSLSTWHSSCSILKHCLQLAVRGGKHRLLLCWSVDWCSDISLKRVRRSDRWNAQAVREETEGDGEGREAWYSCWWGEGARRRGAGKVGYGGLGKWGGRRRGIERWVDQGGEVGRRRAGEERWERLVLLNRGGQGRGVVRG